MKQKTLAKWLKAIIVGLGICGVLVYFVILPMIMKDTLYDDLESYFLPWIIFLWTTSIPCYAVLFFAWKVAGNIGLDKSFCMENAVCLKRISYMAIVDSVYFFVGNIVLCLFNISHPGVFIASLFVIFLGVVIAVAAAVLSHLIVKAAELQEESDLTI
ncbi:MAG: DUF2975 domain-containing protein [Lachnospiraceae bacterium]|nr:DUF2975 domain-containing protein [Lachnospiraceae bacterium]